MGTGYTRNDTANNIADGNVINASDLDGEFDAVQAAFNGTTGHSHDGTSGEGPQIDTAGLADNAVTTAKITDANVTLAKMAANSVDSDQYVDGSIDRVHLAADIVDGTKIADDSINSEHYVDGSIDTAHIGNLQVTTAKIAADAIDGTKLADNAVDSEHYTDGSIDRVHLAADIVDGTKIADDSIDSEHYVDGSIDTAHIADDAVTSAKLDTNIQIAGTLGVTGETTLSTHLNMGDNDILKLGAGSDLQIYHDASNSQIINSVGHLNIDNNGNDKQINLRSDDGSGGITNYIRVNGNTGEVQLYNYGSEKLATTSQGIDVTGTVTADLLTVDGTGASSFTSTSTTPLQINGASIPTLRVNNTVGSVSTDVRATTTEGLIRTSTNHPLVFGTNQIERMRLEAGGNFTFNEDSADIDFRVESNNQTHAFFVDAGNDRIGVNDSSPLSDLHIKHQSDIGTGQSSGLGLESGTGSQMYLLQCGKSGQSNSWFNLRDRTNSRDIFSVDETAGKFYLWNDGDFRGRNTFNEGGSDHDFRVESNSNTHLLFVDGGNNVVSINESSPQAVNALTVRNDDTAARVISTSVYNSILKIKNGTGAADSNATIRFQASDADEGYISFVKVAANYGKMEFNLRNVGARYNTLTLNPGVESVFNDEGKSNQDFRIESNGATHALFVDSGGDDICIGGTDPNPGNGNTNTGFGFRNLASATSTMFSASRTDGNCARFNYNTSGTTSGTVVMLSLDGVSKGSIAVSSSGTTYNTTSDHRLKTDINPIADATEKLMAMNPVTHKWIANPDDNAVHGFIAQEMQEIMPEAVTGEDDGEEMMSMDYGRITPILVAALQESNKKIEQLEARIAELEVK